MGGPTCGGHAARALRWRGMLRLLALARCMAAALMTSGCLTTSPQQYAHNGFKVGPNYHRPPAPVAAEWIGAKDPHVQDRHLQDWWRVFQDATLDSLVETAYRQNPNLRAAGTRVLQ